MIFFALLSSFRVIIAKHNSLGVLTIRLTRVKCKIRDVRWSVLYSTASSLPHKIDDTTPMIIFFALLSSFRVIIANRNLLGVLTLRLTREKCKIHNNVRWCQLVPIGTQNYFFCSVIFFWGYCSQTQLSWGFNNSFDVSEMQNTRN